MTTPLCRFPGCDRPMKSIKRRLCVGHLRQVQRGTPLRPLRPYSPRPYVSPRPRVPVEFRGPREQGPWTGQLRELVANWVPPGGRR